MVNIRDWCKNGFEVINQLRINHDTSHHRYDVILLINGLPVTQIELKTLEVSPRRAMEQIVDYKKDPGNGYTNTLLCFMQLFIVSNRTSTHYFANNNNRHFAFNAEEKFLPIYQFASRDNTKISYLEKFADAFLPKCTLGHMISRYMVLVASEQKMLMMRPYQIYAVKDIVDCINQNCGNGYIWHTTGSGKTLTSFKASTLLKDNDDIDKCLFVVDRKDLDRQTREEFNKFQENCVEENTNTHNLVRRLLSRDKSDKVIVTTIQKLGLALDGTNTRNYKKQLAELSGKRMAIIFDECHRSQFGKNHDAIKSFFPKSQLFASIQSEKAACSPDFRPLRIACVFSPPAEGDTDVRQLQEDLPQEKEDLQQDPDGKKAALIEIIAAYNSQYGTNHRITDFDAYYQDIQTRIKSQQFPNFDLPAKEKIDITIVVDMLLTGFDSKYLNTLYVDKNLKYHGLIQALSRTNRVLNDTKPSGNILDFRQQQDAVDDAIKLFSGEYQETAREIWLVDPAPTVIEKLQEAVKNLGAFMQSHGLEGKAEDVPQLKGDIAETQFVRKFKEVQKLKTQLDQYSDLSPEQKSTIEATLPVNEHRAFKGVYIDTARDLKEKRDKANKDDGENVPPEVEELDFEFVLFASATIDYDYIMQLLADFSQDTPGKQTMTREQLVSVVAAEAKFADQRDQITAYIKRLQAGAGLNKEQIISRLREIQSHRRGKGTHGDLRKPRYRIRSAHRLHRRNPPPPRLRCGTTDRPDGTVGARLERTPQVRASFDGRPRPASQAPRQPTNHLRPFRV